MSSRADTSKEVCAIYVDMGTTNTRAWLMRGSRVIARLGSPVGVRDTARDRSPQKVHAALRELIGAFQAQIKTVSSTPASKLKSGLPVCVAAAGMIGSPLGLAEVPHLQAPVGMAEIAAAAQWVQFPEITDLPILLIPGVRSGPAAVKFDTIHTTDVMRGEETLCIGLASLGYIQPPAVVLNLGSHWKAIQLDAEGRIESSSTSLSGELVHAAQSQTILASALPEDRASVIAEPWMKAGMREQRRSGLARAAFSVRLLQLANQGAPEERLSFLIGAFVASEMDALIARRVLAEEKQVAIVGIPALAAAWRSALMAMSVPASVLSPAETEDALLTGLRCILEKCLTMKDTKARKGEKPSRR
ncbi:MAG TPA: 2-dehydro-3-deoxygalactonokinase [Terriglobales bacterium]|nr:2-dehydro-3-deoxygalactonokinase [Terriglobales bacterium]